MAANADKIIDLDRKRMAAMAEKDVATLNAVLATIWSTHIPPPDWIQSKA